MPSKNTTAEARQNSNHLSQAAFCCRAFVKRYGDLTATLKRTKHEANRDKLMENYRIGALHIHSGEAA
jgi:hypothetical protein